MTVILNPPEGQPLIPTLAQRINAIRASVEYIKKDATVSTGRDNYKAVSHDAVVGMVRPHLIEHGVLIVPTLVSCAMNPPLGDSKQRLFEAIYDVAFISTDNRGDREVMRLPAHAMDSGDKAPGKATSYAVKVATLKMFNIETGESDESRYSDAEDAEAPVVEAFVKQLAGASSTEVLAEIYSTALDTVEGDVGREQIIYATKVRRAALAKEKKGGGE